MDSVAVPEGGGVEVVIVIDVEGLAGSSSPAVSGPSIHPNNISNDPEDKISTADQGRSAMPVRPRGDALSN